MNLHDYNNLSRVIDDTYGQSSSESAGAMKCFAKITGEDRMTMTCMIVVNLLNRSEMQKSKKDAESSLNSLANDCLKNIKKDFKDLAGRALKTKKVSSDTSVELISMSSYSPKGTALVRQVHVFEIS
jgi:hypothetical protein